MNKFLEEDLNQVGKNLKQLQLRIKNEKIFAKSNNPEELRKAAIYFKSHNLDKKSKDCLAKIPKNTNQLLLDIKNSENAYDLSEALKELIKADKRPNPKDIFNAISNNNFSWRIPRHFNLC